jgi:hypothetical protein
MLCGGQRLYNDVVKSPYIDKIYETVVEKEIKDDNLKYVP